MTNRTQSNPHKHSSDWKDWENSGKNALKAARVLLKCGQYNYACYVGQEALELYGKALLVRHDEELNMNEVRHQTWLYFFNAVLEYSSGISKRNPDAWNTFKNMLVEIQNEIKSKIRSPEMCDGMWLRHILAPSATKDADILVYKSPGQTIKKIKNAGNRAMQQCDPQLKKFVGDITDDRSIENISMKSITKKLESAVAASSTSNTKEYKRLIPVLKLITHVHALILANIHQQRTRYPIIVDGQSVKFSINEINNLGISNTDYESKRYVTNASYTADVAKSMFDMFEAAIDDIKRYLHPDE